jgi:hypothetical protein
MACQLCYNVIQDMTNNFNQTLFDKYVEIACNDELLTNGTCSIIKNNSNSVYILFTTMLNTGIICKQLQLCLFELISKFMYT